MSNDVEPAGEDDAATSETVLTPGEAMYKAFMDNADKDNNAANDEFVQQARDAIRRLSE